VNTYRHNVGNVRLWRTDTAAEWVEGVKLFTSNFVYLHIDRKKGENQHFPGSENFWVNRGKSPTSKETPCYSHLQVLDIADNGWKEGLGA